MPLPNSGIIEFQHKPDRAVNELGPKEHHAINQFFAYDNLRVALHPYEREIKPMKQIPYDKLEQMRLKANIDPLFLFGLLIPNDEVDGKILNYDDDIPLPLRAIKDTYYEMIVKKVIPTLDQPWKIMLLSRTIAEAQLKELEGKVDLPDQYDIHDKRADLRRVLNCTALVSQDHTLLNT